MTGNKNPSDVFYWNDWEDDKELRSCQMAAQGMWMRMLCIARRSPEPGFVLIPGRDCARSALPGVLARLVGESPTAVKAWIDDLVASGAASVDERGYIYCRRMVRAAAVSQARAESGRAGGYQKAGKRAGKRPSKTVANEEANGQATPVATDEATPVANDLASSLLRPTDLRSDTSVEVSAAPAPQGAPDVASLIFQNGREWLERATGRNSEACRRLLGQWRANYGDEALLAVLGKAQREAPIDAIGWIERVLKYRGPHGSRTHDQGRTANETARAGIAAALLDGS